MGSFVSEHKSTVGEGNTVTRLARRRRLRTIGKRPTKDDVHQDPALLPRQDAEPAGPRESKERTGPRESKERTGPEEDGRGKYDRLTEMRGDGQAVLKGLEGIILIIQDLNAAQSAEIEQSAKLRESVDGLTQAIKGLDRTVAALLDEVAGPGGSAALAPVVIVRKAMADSAAEDAAAHAGDATKGLFQEVLGKLKGIGHPLWSMLAHLGTVRQWTFGGEIGIPGLVKATVTVTMGE
jgi:hypothetical protein